MQTTPNFFLSFIEQKQDHYLRYVNDDSFIF
jgi:hypothetical protein